MKQRMRKMRTRSEETNNKRQMADSTRVGHLLQCQSDEESGQKHPAAALGDCRVQPPRWSHQGYSTHTTWSIELSIGITLLAISDGIDGDGLSINLPCGKGRDGEDLNTMVVNHHKSRDDW